MRQAIIAIISICISLISMSAVGAGADLSACKNPGTIFGSGFVYRVVDGDTIVVNVNNQDVFRRFVEAADTREKLKHLNHKYQSVKMRLGNINTDESVHPDRARNGNGGKQASNFLKNVAEKREVEFVCWDHGSYGRAICGASINGYDLGIIIISEGHSGYETRWGKHPCLHREYTQAEREGAR